MEEVGLPTVLYGRRFHWKAALEFKNYIIIHFEIPDTVV